MHTLEMAVHALFELLGMQASLCFPASYVLLWAKTIVLVTVCSLGMAVHTLFELLGTQASLCFSANYVLLWAKTIVLVTVHSLGTAVHTLFELLGMQCFYYVPRPVLVSMHTSPTTLIQFELHLQNHTCPYITYPVNL